jgi:hypothetical protein
MMTKVGARGNEGLGNASRVGVEDNPGSREGNAGYRRYESTRSELRALPRERNSEHEPKAYEPKVKANLK